MKRLRLQIVVIGGAAIFGVAGSTTSASAAAPTTNFAAYATAYQNAVIGDAMAHHPGGVRISAGQAKWPDGTIVGAPLSPKDPNPPCPLGDFCGYAAINFTGGYKYYPNGYGWVPWGMCSPTRYPGCDTGTHSWLNFSEDRVWLEQDKGGGNEYCIAPKGLSTNYGVADFTGVNVNDYWWLISENEETC
jgi:hypothetical protein